MTAPSRRAPQQQQHESLLPYLQADLKANRINMNEPGRTLEVLNVLPARDRANLVHGLRLYDDQVEKGRHGDTAKLCKDLEVDPGVAKRVYEGATVDYVCSRLIERKSDATLPLDPPTRRDHLSAAFDLHNPKE